MSQPLAQLSLYNSFLGTQEATAAEHTSSSYPQVSGPLPLERKVPGLRIQESKFPAPPP